MAFVLAQKFQVIQLFTHLKRLLLVCSCCYESCVRFSRQEGSPQGRTVNDAVWSRRLASERLSPKLSAAAGFLFSILEASRPLEKRVQGECVLLRVRVLRRVLVATSRSMLHQGKVCWLVYGHNGVTL